MSLTQQAAAPRSKTVLLVKNLPANTDPEDLRAVFSKHGSLGRVILPPSGVTAIIEYLDPTEAKLGFRNLAYTKVCKISLVECQFQDLPDILNRFLPVTLLLHKLHVVYLWYMITVSACSPVSRMGSGGSV